MVISPPNIHPNQKTPPKTIKRNRPQTQPPVLKRHCDVDSLSPFSIFFWLIRCHKNFMGFPPIRSAESPASRLLGVSLESSVKSNNPLVIKHKARWNITKNYSSKIYLELSTHGAPPQKKSSSIFVDGIFHERNHLAIGVSP